MKHVFVHLAEGFEEVEALAVVDILRRAEIKVTMVSVTDNLLVTGAHHIVVKADVLFDQANYANADMLFLPGGIPGANNLEAHQGLRGHLETFNADKKFLAAICAAPYILGKLNFMHGKKATCYPGFESYLAGAELSDEKAVVDGHIITGKGIGASFDFALLLVEKLVTKEVANALRTKMVVQ